MIPLLCIWFYEIRFKDRGCQGCVWHPCAVAGTDSDWLEQERLWLRVPTCCQSPFLWSTSRPPFGSQKWRAQSWPSVICPGEECQRQMWSKNKWFQRSSQERSTVGFDSDKKGFAQKVTAHLPQLDIGRSDLAKMLSRYCCPIGIYWYGQYNRIFSQFKLTTMKISQMFAIVQKLRF